jgi:hypothetical protein
MASPQPAPQISLSGREDCSAKKSTRFVILSIARNSRFWEFVCTQSK